MLICYCILILQTCVIITVVFIVFVCVCDRQLRIPLVLEPLDLSSKSVAVKYDDMSCVVQ